MNLTVRELTNILKGELILGDPRTAAVRAVVDSRQVQAGDLFFALKGARVDGHDFALSVCQKEVSGVVVSSLEWLKQAKGGSSSVIQVADTLESLKLLAQHLRIGFKGPVIGITGSNGKTTTKQMVSSLMTQTGPGLSTQGNFNSQIGLPMVLSQIAPEDQWMVLEMGASEPGNIAALADIAHPTIGILTSIGPAHLQTFGSLARIAQAKWELMDSLPTNGCAIVPWGEPHLDPHIRGYQKRIVFFGEDSSCPVRAAAIDNGNQVQFRLEVGGRSERIRLPVGGRFNVMNALAAAACGWVLEIPFEKIVNGLQTFEPPKMRMEQRVHPSGAILINDAYNANPASMVQSVRSLIESNPGRKKILVLGSMKELGEESETYHFHVGVEVGRSHVAHVFLVGYEAKKIREGAMSAGAKATMFTVVNEWGEVASLLSPFLQSDSVLLFKGSRTMQLEKIIEALN